MRKQEYLINVNYEKMGTRYIFNGQRLNTGEFIECLVALYQYEEKNHKKDSVGFDKGSDIEYNGAKASVKSREASLTELIKVYDNSEQSKIQVIKEFINRTASLEYVYGIIVNDILLTYTMNLKEFERFMFDMGKLDNPDKKFYKLRFRKADSVVIQYFENILATA